jgi:hypothetical protein
VEGQHTTPPESNRLHRGSGSEGGALIFKRRLGLSPVQRGSATNCSCPDVFELATGDFAVIGTDRTDELRSLLPPDAAIADYERLVVVDRRTLIAAKADIPES